MAYKKPQMVAKSVAKKSYVAGCPTNTGIPLDNGCSFNINCEVGKRK